MLPFAAVLLAAVPLADEPAAPPDLSCDVYSSFATGAQRGWRLKVSGPKETKWEVRFESEYAQERRLVASGTYELVDGLAVFTGKTDQAKETRFALTYGFFGGKVYFNTFLPATDGELRYRRQWFRKVGDEWKLSEELVLALPRTLPDKDRWEQRLTGERRRCDEAGKLTVAKIEKTLTYQQDREKLGLFHYQQARPADDPVPVPQRLKVVGQRLEDDPTCLDFMIGPVPRGFGAGLPPDIKLGPLSAGSRGP
jgi:hypothetical protein